MRRPLTRRSPNPFPTRGVTQSWGVWLPSLTGRLRLASGCCDFQPSLAALAHAMGVSESDCVTAGGPPRASTRPRTRRGGRQGLESAYRSSGSGRGKTRDDVRGGAAPNWRPGAGATDAAAAAVISLICQQRWFSVHQRLEGRLGRGCRELRPRSRTPSDGPNET
jgi:hypothetical protein